MPKIGFGTYKTSVDTDGVQVIRDAIACGYRMLDTAAMYGNEKEVGEAIRLSGIDRRELFITTKLDNKDRGYDSALRAFDVSMANLGLDYLDLYLIHWPASETKFPDWKEINSESWRALERLYKEGRVRAIGVSNFLTPHLQALIESATVTPMVNQIEFHPGWMQPETFELCNKLGIAVEGWSPLGRTRVLEDPLLIELAEKYKKSTAQICLRWELQHNVVPIPKSTHPERMRQNLELFDFHLSEEDMKRIDSMPETGASGLLPDTIAF